MSWGVHLPRTPMKKWKGNQTVLRLDFKSGSHYLLRYRDELAMMTVILVAKVQPTVPCLL